MPFAATDESDVLIAIVDVGRARAFWEGVPVARLLARVRLHRDERDLVDLDARASGVDFSGASWDTILARLVAHAPTSLDRLKRRIARHARAAWDDGPLPASDPAVAALVYAALSSIDEEASAAEGVADAGPIEDAFARGALVLDERLVAGGDVRAPIFEACLELATEATTSEMRLGDVRSALDGLTVVASGPLYPWGDPEIPLSERRTTLLDRGDLERRISPHERDRQRTSQSPLAREIAHLLSRRGDVLLVAAREPRSLREAPELPPASWFPADLGSPDAPKALAGALERGATTAPRVHALLTREGDRALDAAGREMLEVASHPFASAVFAEILASISRERDVVRLVTYFAIAPDPAPAARALSMCTARELPTVLRGWLESTLPRDRLLACIAALEPYPSLRDAVKPILG